MLRHPDKSNIFSWEECWINLDIVISKKLHSWHISCFKLYKCNKPLLVTWYKSRVINISNFVNFSIAAKVWSVIKWPGTSEDDILKFI